MEQRVVAWGQELRAVHARLRDALEIDAIMETHFRFEEKRLVPVLDAVRADLDPAEIFGPLA